MDLKKQWGKLFKPVSNETLVYFRVCFGLVLMYQVARYFNHGWVLPKYANTFQFKYFLFDWVKPFPDEGLYFAMAMLGLASLSITFGLFTRGSATLIFLGNAYFFLLDRANYLNHMYLVTLVSFLLLLMPLAGQFSLDAKFRFKKKIKQVPYWTIFLLRLQIGAAYVFGGVAKINADWLAGQPLQMWLHRRAVRWDVPFLGEPLLAFFMSYTGLLFDLLIPFALMYRRTRVLAVLASIAFHTTNHYLFNIGIFPIFMFLVSPIFFEPDFFSRLMGKKTAVPSEIKPANQVSNKFIGTFVAFWLVLQIGMPLRHWAYPGDVAWNEEGHLYSWRMKLRTKKGRIVFVVQELPDGKKIKVNPKRFLTHRQFRKMKGRPELIRQFAHHIGNHYKELWGVKVAVYAHSWARLNHHKAARLIDPTKNLLEKEDSLWPADWILQRRD